MPKKKLFDIPEDVDSVEVTEVTEEQVDDSLPVVAPVVAEVDTAKEPKELAGPTPTKRDNKGQDKKRRNDAGLITKEELRVKRLEEKRARLLRQRDLDITKFEGITVGGRATVDTRKSRRLTRDRRRETIERRKNMKVSIGGEEKEISEASKYMLDMLIKDK